MHASTLLRHCCARAITDSEAAEENLASLKKQLAATKVDHKEFRPGLIVWCSLADEIAM